jgi:hypothetical protein
MLDTRFGFNEGVDVADRKEGKRIVDFKQQTINNKQ